MKTSFAAIASLILGASMAMAALEPHATAAPMHRRQSMNSGVDVSALLANPSSYLKEASSLFKENPKYASEFSKATANPKFQSSLSKELVEQFGSKTASIALQQYTAALAVNSSPTAASSSSAAANNDVVAAAAASGSDAVSSAATATAASPSASSTGGVMQVSGAHTSGASTAFTVTFVGSAITLGTVVVMAAL